MKDLVSRERAVTLEILVHLIEVERRRLHLGLGYSSMFDYCTRHLGYSSSAAGRRIPAARCIRDYPEVHALLQKNEVNLSSLSLVASILTRENKDTLLTRISNKSQKEVEAIVADYKPPVSLRDRARPVCVAVASSSVPGAPGSPSSGASATSSSGEDWKLLASSTGVEDGCDTIQTQRTSGCDYSRCGSEKRPNKAADDFVGGPSQAVDMTQAQRQAANQNSNAHPCLPMTEEGQTSGAPRLERRFQVQFLAGEQFMQKFERAKALLSNKNVPLSYEAVLEAALDEFLKDHDPEQRKQRRDERKEKTEARTKPGERVAKRTLRSRTARRVSGAGCGQADVTLVASDRAGCGQVDDPSYECDRAGGRQADGPLFRRRAGGLPSTRVVADPCASRRIPASVRDAVFKRDKGRCTYVGANGERCASTHHLQIDHVVPYARGGTNALHNLRLLCERHNKLEAERVYGADAMKRYRARE